MPSQNIAACEVSMVFLLSDLVNWSKNTMEMYVILLLPPPTTTSASEKYVSHLTYNIINLEDAAYSFRC